MPNPALQPRISASLFSRAAPALFPLVVAALGYLFGQHYFGF
ncbi:MULTISPECIES: hypothetical protein [unclassified Mesorhizobium]|nr:MULTISPECIES: hypothetical protein [unclassified Mesorhizobium]